MSETAASVPPDAPVVGPALPPVVDTWVSAWHQAVRAGRVADLSALSASAPQDHYALLAPALLQHLATPGVLDGIAPALWSRALYTFCQLLSAHDRRLMARALWDAESASPRGPEPIRAAMAASWPQLCEVAWSRGRGTPTDILHAWAREPDGGLDVPSLLLAQPEAPWDPAGLSAQLIEEARQDPHRGTVRDGLAGRRYALLPATSLAAPARRVSGLVVALALLRSDRVPPADLARLDAALAGDVLAELLDQTQASVPLSPQRLRDLGAAPDLSPRLRSSAHRARARHPDVTGAELLDALATLVPLDPTAAGACYAASAHAVPGPEGPAQARQWTVLLAHGLRPLRLEAVRRLAEARSPGSSPPAARAPGRSV